MEASASISIMDAFSSAQNAQHDQGVPAATQLGFRVRPRTPSIQSTHSPPLEAATALPCAYHGPVLPERCNLSSSHLTQP